MYFPIYSRLPITTSHFSAMVFFFRLNADFAGRVKARPADRNLAGDGQRRAFTLRVEENAMSYRLSLALSAVSSFVRV